MDIEKHTLKESVHRKQIGKKVEDLKSKLEDRIKE